MRRAPLRSATSMSVARALMFVGPRYCHGTVREGDDWAMERYASYALSRYSASAVAGGCAPSAGSSTTAAAAANPLIQDTRRRIRQPPSESHEPIMGSPLGLSGLRVAMS